jgi:DNA-directed RNA polymerase specialized sigma24 family protein
MSVLEKLAKKHSTWINIVKSFGSDNPEDIVQDMYLTIHKWSQGNGRSILYKGDDINHYFVFKTLRTLFVNDLKNNRNDLDINDVEVGYDPEYESEFDAIKERLSALYWYDRKVFEYVYIKGFSMLQLSEMTGISYYSIKRTILKVKKQLKNETW